MRHGQTGTYPYPRRRTSPLTGNGQVPIFVCPAVRLCLLASRTCYNPLIFRFASTVLGQYIFPCRNSITFFRKKIYRPVHNSISSFFTLPSWWHPPLPSRTGCFAAKVAAATSPGKPGCAASDMAGIFLCSSPRAYFRRQFCPTVRRAACVGRKTTPQQAGRKRPKAGKEHNICQI